MGFFSESRLLAYTHTRTHLLLMTFFKCYWIVFLWELSTPTYTAAPPSPPLPTVCRKHSSLLWRCRSRRLMHSQIPGSFLGNEGLKRYIHVHTQTGKAKTEGGVQNTARQVYLRRLFDSEEVGLTVCLLQEANEKHILLFPRLLCDNPSRCGI